MSINFPALFRAIEAEIQEKYISGAIRWCDDNFDGAWSKAMNQFENALSMYQSNLNLASLSVETDKYKNTVVKLLSEFKSHKKINDTDSFLKSLKTKGD